MKFRELRADEIEARVNTISEKGCSLLLYKDARCDMRILDETVGALSWQRKHEVINGNLFCNVGILSEFTGEWIWKQDVGTESYTEKEKGQASDAFKRACVNWGIGRELYTAPWIWINKGNVNMQMKNGKWTTYDRFKVEEISYEDGKIVDLIIVNEKLERVVYKMNGFVKAPSEDDLEEQEQEAYPSREEMLKICEKKYKGERLGTLLDYYEADSLKGLTDAQLIVAFNKA